MMKKLGQYGYVCLNCTGDFFCVSFATAVATVSLICLATLIWVVTLVDSGLRHLAA